MTAAPSAAAAGPRLAVLDALRGLSVLAMIHQHVGIWLWRGPDPGMDRFDYPGLVLLNTMVVMGAPMFYALSGVGTALLCGRTRPGLDAVLVRRGAMLWGYGLLVNLLTPSWFSWGSFFALHLMGVAIASAPLWRRLPDAAILAAAAVVLAATPLVQSWLELPPS
ncbi:MAG: heparan-alpha-glucosaminide N-acetyltransferase domain-containing protein [Nannocystaceae bacterium]